MLVRKASFMAVSEGKAHHFLSVYTELHCIGTEFKSKNVFVKSGS
jgi:hypothetical protein